MDNTVPVNLGFASSGAHHSDASKPFAHSVSSGFQLNQISSAIEWVEQYKTQIEFNGIVVQIPWESPLEQSISAVEGALEKYSGTLIINLKLSKSNPAEANFNEQAISDRICLALDLIDPIERAELQIDTLMTLERGYSPRTGLFDRLSNLTQVGRRISSF